MLAALSLALGMMTEAKAQKVSQLPEATTASGTDELMLNAAGTSKRIDVDDLFEGRLITGGLTASGSATNDFSGSTGAFKTSTGVNTFGGSSHVFAATLEPATSDGAALGTASKMFSDLFLASGSVINFNNGDVTATHSSNVLTIAGGNLIISTPGTASGSVATIDGTQTLTNKTLTSPVIATIASALTLDATTPSLTTASGKTNSGFVLINGKTSGGLKLATTDASGFTLTVQNAAIATADRTLTLPDPGGSDSVVYLALAGTLTNKTLTAPVINGATSASGNFNLSGSSGTTATTTGLTTISGGLVGSIQALSGAGAVNLTTTTTAWTTTGADAGTLADGTNGQIKVVVLKVDGGNGTLTPSTASGFTSLTFDDPGDTAVLQFHSSIGWVILSTRSVTVNN
jgi:hypothetical protein